MEASIGTTYISCKTDMGTFYYIAVWAGKKRETGRISLSLLVVSISWEMAYSRIIEVQPTANRIMTYF